MTSRALTVVFLCGLLASASGAEAGARGRLQWDDRVHPNGGAEAIAKQLAVMDGRVFAGGWVENGDAGFDWIVRSVDATTGALQWEDVFDIAQDGQFVESVAAGEGRTFAVGVIGTGTSADWLVKAYDATTGAVLWQDQVHHDDGFDAARAVAIDDAKVYVSGPSDQADGDPADVELLVRAYDAATGQVAWETVVEPPAGAFGFDVGYTSPTVVDDAGHLYVAGILIDQSFGLESVVWAFDTGTGSLLWQDQLSANGTNDQPWGLVALGGKVFVSALTGGISHLRAYDAATGNVVWEDLVDEGGFGPFLGGQGTVVVESSETCLGTCNLTVRGYDAASGALLWSDTLARKGNQFGASVAVSEGQAIVLADDQPKGATLDDARVLVRSYDLSSGRLAWQATADGSPWSAAVSNSTLFVSGWGTDPGTGHIDFAVRAFQSAALP